MQTLKHGQNWRSSGPHQFWLSTAIILANAPSDEVLPPVISRQLVQEHADNMLESGYEIRQSNSRVKLLSTTLYRQEWRRCKEGQETKPEKYSQVRSGRTIKMSDIYENWETESVGMEGCGWEE